MYIFSVVVSEFEKATLECTATGSPPPRIEWRRADNAVLPTGGVVYRGQQFQIHSVKREDRGTYFCVADNGVGKAKKRHVALEVEFAPNFVDAVEQELVRQAYGYSVRIVCSVEAFPPSVITWTHKNILVSINNFIWNMILSTLLISRNLTMRRTCPYTEVLDLEASHPPH